MLADKCLLDSQRKRSIRKHSLKPSRKIVAQVKAKTNLNDSHRRSKGFRAKPDLQADRHLQWAIEPRLPVYHHHLFLVTPRPQIQISFQAVHHLPFHRLHRLPNASPPPILKMLPPLRRAVRRLLPVLAKSPHPHHFVQNLLLHQLHLVNIFTLFFVQTG